MFRTPRATLAAALAGLVGLIGAAPAFAAIIPQYDITLQRTRDITASGSHAIQFYDAHPVYVQIPGGSVSNSTPTVIGNTAYQYTFTTSGVGYLSAITIPSMTPAQVSAHLTSGYWVRTAQYAAPPIRFAVGFSPSGNNAANGQDSLTTGPYTSTTGPGTLAGNIAYQAIAVGQYLYTWPQSAYPTGGRPAGQRVFIQGNKNNTDYQVDMNPLITPPVTVHGTNSAGGSTSWVSPMAVAESWNGGAVAYPTNVPSGDIPPHIAYSTSQTGPGGIGTAQYPNATAPLTSDPVWIGSADGLGSAVVAFGVASLHHPRVILWNVVTGQYKAIGVGQIGTKIWDAPLYDPANGTLYVQDAYGGLYAFSVATGQLIAVYGSSPWVNDQRLTIAKDMALDGNVLYAVGEGNNAIGAFKLNLQPLCSTGTGATLTGCTDVTTAYGPNVNSPAVLTDRNGNTTLVINNAQGDLWLEASQDLFGLHGGTYAQARVVPLGSSYIGFLPDAGSSGNLIGWTNSDPQGKPALVVFVPEPYHVAMAATPATVPSGGSVLLTATPSPSGVTWDQGLNPYTADGTNAPVAYRIIGPTGYLYQPGAPYQHGSGGWAATWTPPPNTTRSPETYTITTTAVDELGQPATSAATTVTVEPVQPTSQNSTVGDLTLTCGYGGGSLPITVPHTCTIPPSVSGNTAAWFVQNPQYGAKFGDTIQLALQIPSPTLPTGDTVDSVVLTATLPYTQGVPNAPGYRGYVPGTGNLYNFFPATVYLTQTGPYTATGHLVESWDGYPPHLSTANVGDPYTLTVAWKAVVTYTYPITVPCPTAQQPHRVCPSTQTAQDRYRGSASAPLTVNGTDYYVIATPIGY